MSQLAINDLNLTEISLLSLGMQNPHQVRGGFGAAPPIGEDGLPLFDRPKRDFEPIEMGGRLLIPQ
jgi:hypothetical protein